MKNPKMLTYSLASSASIMLYVTAISLIMSNGDKIFGQKDNFFTPVAVLMMFVFSAAITSSLFFALPAYLFINESKKDAAKALIFNISWLFVGMILAFAITFVLR